MRTPLLAELPPKKGGWIEIDTGAQILRGGRVKHQTLSALSLLEALALASKKEVAKRRMAGTMFARQLAMNSRSMRYLEAGVLPVKFSQVTWPTLIRHVTGF